MLHKALRLIRQYHSQSQLELSQSIGITKDRLVAIEFGNEVVTKDILEKYSTLFDIPVSSLVFFSESLNKEGKFTKKIRSKLAGKALQILEWKIKQNEPKVEA
ncbi:Transcriptional regulator [Vibrio crassostreae]|uniref:helix-turn-helix transcriptional regulator n=1 Tax=Vibrio TaxID=662 RepID=UPI0002F14C68|nr:helix-turn-helix transcriptional regulator [Vibrio splendidus]OEF73972.1 transcriptional regulator [Vibrio splendidus 1F-157]PTP59684.1 XRE family transcriptional regulator [Vibrio splendidus]CAK3469375.1 Transcriptional regulator [Vibrio crassostreae]CAK3907146.1 Transcriptional regulator [Vibrio crassostreae]